MPESKESKTEARSENQIMDINLKGTFFMCRYAIPALEKTGGSIVNVGSDSGLTGNVEAACVLRLKKSPYRTRNEYNEVDLKPYPDGTGRFVSPEEVA